MIDEKTLREEYVDQATAAKMLNISRARINVLCRGGRFCGALKAGWSWIIPKVAVENFKRLRRGPRPRQTKSESDREVWEKALHEAQNLKESDNND